MRSSSMYTEFDRYLQRAREDVLSEIHKLTSRGARYGAQLYSLMLDYPLRSAKGLRPALCMAVSGLLGAPRDAALPSATALELYHNAFLIHDDIEDDSALRRHEPTLHQRHGVPIALHVGDGMLALALDPLMANTEVVGLARALRVLKIFARMARESAEGQMMELEWIRRAEWELRERDYVRMVYKKTAWYTFVAPVLVGAAIARGSSERVRALVRVATLLGVAFQVADDLLDLQGYEEQTGKRTRGDLWEGKRTLCLLHAVRHASAEERRELKAILERPRPSSEPEREALIEQLLQRVVDDDSEREAFRARLCGPPRRSQRDVDRLWSAMAAAGSFSYARRFASRRAERAAETLARACSGLPRSEHRSFLESLVAFTVERSR